MCFKYKMIINKKIFTIIFNKRPASCVAKQSAELGSATQHAIYPEFGKNLGAVCLNTRLPLSTCGIQREIEKNIAYIQYVDEWVIT